MIKVEAAHRITAADGIRESEIDRLYKALGFKPNQHGNANGGYESSMSATHGEIFMELTAANVAKLAAVLTKHKGMTIKFYKDGDDVCANISGVSVAETKY